jgi:pimeloyl-ACP methyl ester carboxylesterase
MLRNGVVGLPTARVAALHGLTMPRLVIFGTDDPVFSKQSPYETATRIGAPAPTLIPNARHLAVISDPVPVAAALDSFRLNLRLSRAQAELREQLTGRSGDRRHPAAPSSG